MTSEKEKDARDYSQNLRGRRILPYRAEPQLSGRSGQESTKRYIATQREGEEGEVRATLVYYSNI